jgi:ribonuclease VapC
MVLDTSAIIATVAKEADSLLFQNAMLGSTPLVMSAVTVLESKIVLHSRHGKAAVQAFEEMLEHAGIVIAPFDAQMAVLAFDAFRRYGLRLGESARQVLAVQGT